MSVTGSNAGWMRYPADEVRHSAAFTHFGREVVGEQRQSFLCLSPNSAQLSQCVNIHGLARQKPARKAPISRTYCITVRNCIAERVPRRSKEKTTRTVLCSTVISKILACLFESAWLFFPDWHYSMGSLLSAGLQRQRQRHQHQHQQLSQVGCKCESNGSLDVERGRGFRCVACLKCILAYRQLITAQKCAVRILPSPFDHALCLLALTECSHSPSCNLEYSTSYRAIHYSSLHRLHRANAHRPRHRNWLHIRSAPSPLPSDVSVCIARLGSGFPQTPARPSNIMQL